MEKFKLLVTFNRVYSQSTIYIHKNLSVKRVTQDKLEKAQQFNYTLLPIWLTFNRKNIMWIVFLLSIQFIYPIIFYSPLKWFLEFKRLQLLSVYLYPFRTDPREKDNSKKSIKFCYYPHFTGAETDLKDLPKPIL